MLKKYIIVQKGLTLIELLVVLALISIIVVISIPKLGINNYTLLSEAKELCMDIRESRFVKMTTGENYKILLNTNGYILFNGSKTIKTVTLSKGNVIYYDDQEIRFSDTGAPVYGGTTITIKNLETNKYYQISIVVGSGRILLKE
jgi:prepilin-type N-terminal cleavage/methylation domain-containing protein